MNILDDLDQEIDQVTSNIKKESIEFKYFYVNVNKNPDMMYFKLIPDSNGVPLKIIRDVREGLLELEDESFRLRVCNKSEFKNLTHSQEILLDELIKELDIYRSKTEDWKFSPFDYYTIFFGVLIRTGNINYDILKTSLFFSSSKNFPKNFRDFYNTNKLLNGNKWVTDYFNRNLNANNLLCLKSHRIDYGYGFDFGMAEEVHELGDEIIDRANNLDEEFIDTLNFDEQFYSTSLEKLIKFNRKG